MWFSACKGSVTCFSRTVYEVLQGSFSAFEGGVACMYVIHSKGGVAYMAVDYNGGGMACVPVIPSKEGMAF